MSKIQPVDGLNRVVIRNYFDEHIGTFQELHCDKHGDTLHLTDSSGSDICITCIKGMIGESK